MEEGIMTDPETAETGGRTGVEKLLRISSEPRSGAVTVQGWNTNHLMIWTHRTDWFPVTHTHH